MGFKMISEFRMNPEFGLNDLENGENSMSLMLQYAMSRKQNMNVRVK